MAGNKNSGGARKGSGPVRRHFTLRFGAALLLRELVRSELRRRDVTEEELIARIESLIVTASNKRLAKFAQTPDQE